jgi:hypothetical protein
LTAKNIGIAVLIAPGVAAAKFSALLAGRDTRKHKW